MIEAPSINTATAVDGPLPELAADRAGDGGAGGGILGADGPADGGGIAPPGDPGSPPGPPPPIHSSTMLLSSDRAGTLHVACAMLKPPTQDIGKSANYPRSRM